MENGNNFEFRCSGKSRDALVQAFDLALTLDRYKAVAYRIEEPFTAEKSWDRSHGHRMVFLWTESEEVGANVLPAPLETGAELAAFAWPWLQRSAVWGREPDIDGGVSKGWLLYEVTRSGYARTFLAVEPYWLEFHK